MSAKTVAVGAGVAALIQGGLSGCATTESPQYQWGAYEQLVYQMYAEPGKAEPGVQVEKLTADVERAEAEDLRVPPGVHAHLGYMYYLQGNESAAYNEFSIERELFPESAIFVDAILRRIRDR